MSTPRFTKIGQEPNWRQFILNFTRLLIYGAALYTPQFADLDPRIGGLVFVATLAAFAGSFVGARLLKKATLHTVQLVVGVLLIGIGDQPIHRLSISVYDTMAYFVLPHGDEPKPPAKEGGRCDEALRASFVGAECVVTSLRSALSAVFRALPVQMAAADFTGTDARVRQTFPANFAAFALNGLFFPTAGKILAAGLLLTWFVSTLTPAAFWVGLIIPIQYGFALVAQPLIGAWLAGRRRRVWYYAAQALLRGGLWALLALAAWRLGADRPALLAIFFGVVVLDAVAAGVGNIALNDALARVIPEPLRGRARSWRGIFGGLTAGAVGILIAIFFSERSGMAAYALLFAASGVLYALGGLTIGLIDDPQEGATSARQPTTRDIRTRIGTLWRDDAFRRFVLTQALLVPLVQGLPFFALLGRRAFNLELDALGPLLIISAVTPIVANAAWGWLADNRGNRWALAAAAALGLLAPILGGILLMAPVDRTAALVLLGGIVFAIGSASTGVDLTTKNIVLDLAPSAAERPLTIGVNDTLVGIPTALLVGAGAIIDLVGFAPIYVGIGALTLLGVVLAGRLPTAAHQAEAVS